jgi:hypothetical protein
VDTLEYITTSKSLLIRYFANCGRVERLSPSLFKGLIKVLEELRGDFLREVGSAVSSHLREILQRRKLSSRRIFENLDNCALDDVQFDSDEIVRAYNEEVH